ncbi:hypothetical protein T06_5821 [Trichinella sp. T6]|nr:hypothetical protein T06_5821 [Trichinella sp. T6]
MNAFFYNNLKHALRSLMLVFTFFKRCSYHLNEITFIIYIAFTESTGTILNVIEFVFNYETPKNGATLLIQINTTLLAKDTFNGGGLSV